MRKLIFISVITLILFSCKHDLDKEKVIQKRFSCFKFQKKVCSISEFSIFQLKLQNDAKHSHGAKHSPPAWVPVSIICKIQVSMQKCTF